MEEVSNVTLEEVMVFADGSFPVQPRRNRLIITVNTAEPDGELVLDNGRFAEAQYVVAVSQNILDVNVGDRVLIDVEKMMEFTQGAENADERVGMLKLHPIIVDEVVYALVSDNVVIATDNR